LFGQRLSFADASLRCCFAKASGRRGFTLICRRCCLQSPSCEIEDSQRSRCPGTARPNREHAMSKIPPTEFGAELVSMMREILDEAVERIDHQHRTPATKAKMAERIVR